MEEAERRLIHVATTYYGDDYAERVLDAANDVVRLQECPACNAIPKRGILISEGEKT